MKKGKPPHAPCASARAPMPTRNEYNEDVIDVVVSGWRPAYKRSLMLSPKVQSFEPSQLIDQVIRPLSLPS